MAAGQMFGEIANPSIRVGSRQWYTVPLSIVAHVHGDRGGGDRAADGDRRAANASDDDGVRGRSASASASAASAASTAAGRGAGAAPRCRRQSECSSGRGPGGDHRGNGLRSHCCRGCRGWRRGRCRLGRYRRRHRGSAASASASSASSRARAGACRRQYIAANQDQGCAAGISAGRAVGPRAGHRHSRSRHRSERAGYRREGAALGAIARRGGDRRGEAVGSTPPRCSTAFPCRSS